MRVAASAPRSGTTTTRRLSHRAGRGRPVRDSCKGVNALAERRLIRAVALMQAVPSAFCLPARTLSRGNVSARAGGQKLTGTS